MDPRMIDDLARRLASSMPESLRSLQEDLEDNFRAVLQAALGKLDLVTREEFEVEAELLRRARHSLTELEQRIAELEAGLEREQD